MPLWGGFFPEDTSTQPLPTSYWNWTKRVFRCVTVQVTNTAKEPRLHLCRSVGLPAVYLGMSLLRVTGDFTVSHYLSGSVRILRSACLFSRRWRAEPRAPTKCSHKDSAVSQTRPISAGSGRCPLKATLACPPAEPSRPGVKETGDPVLPSSL